ncbi:hypothetical protein [Salinibacter ruber]|uniref:hypothetical protein n=1 Tax=Salinibacter ruber TaxID=146919 RepID=UPI002168C1A0|nr:hypothetical protein [Salinibacter ruber]MCS3783618.1 hypothetical protein [Salinibacter ruber]MCS4138428.1 hypothetical protein [Salinibacter ruber]
MGSCDFDHCLYHCGLSLNEPYAAAVGAETAIDEELQMFADWGKAYYADRPVLEV